MPTHRLSLSTHTCSILATVTSVAVAGLAENDASLLHSRVTYGLIAYRSVTSVTPLSTTSSIFNTQHIILSANKTS